VCATDLGVKERELVQASSLNPVLKEKLKCRSLKAEQDIKEGRVMSKDELISRTNKMLGK